MDSDYNTSRNSCIHPGERGYTGVAYYRTASAVQVLARLYPIFLSMFLPANLPCGVSIDLSTHHQSLPIHHSLASLALRAHCYSIISIFPVFTQFRFNSNIHLHFQYLNHFILILDGNSEHIAHV